MAIQFGFMMQIGQYPPAVVVSPPVQPPQDATIIEAEKVESSSNIGGQFGGRRQLLRTYQPNIDPTNLPPQEQGYSKRGEQTFFAPPKGQFVDLHV